MIDENTLPANALIDTCVLVRALGQYTDDKSRACSEFVEAMAARERPLYIAAPTLSEYHRAASGAPPMVPWIVPVAFDQEAAEILGKKFPETVFIACKTADGVAGDYIKYDAMILACAIKWKLACIVTTDGHPESKGVDASRLFRLAKIAGFTARHPSFFQGPQVEIEAVVTAPKQLKAKPDLKLHQGKGGK